jgi:hypothetical protein
MREERYVELTEEQFEKLFPRIPFWLPIVTFIVPAVLIIGMGLVTRWLTADAKTPTPEVAKP